MPKPLCQTTFQTKLLHQATPQAGYKSLPTLSSFFGSKALKKHVCVLSHSIALKSYKMFSKLDKNTVTVDQSCRNSSPKRKYFELKKNQRQIRFDVLHFKADDWPNNSPQIQSQNSERFFMKSGI